MRSYGHFVSDRPLWTTVHPPRQGLGLMRLREQGDADPDRNPVAVVHAALDAGITLLDTAEMYGNEELVGRIIAGRRDEVTLCSKFGVVWGDSGRFDDWAVRADAATVVSSCEASLRRLGVDVIDLYYLHHRSEDTPIEETVTAMAGLVAAGKIRAVGLSNVTVDDIQRAHTVHPVLAVQEELSLSSRGVEAMLPVLADLGITLVAHSPTGHGALHQRSNSAARSCAERHRHGARGHARPGRAGLGPSPEPPRSTRGALARHDKGQPPSRQHGRRHTRTRQDRDRPPHDGRHEVAVVRIDHRRAVDRP